MLSAKESCCDNCRNQRFELYICVVCRSTTCHNCNITLHSKPSAKQHKRISKKLNVFDYQFSYDLPIAYFSAEFYRTQVFSRDPLIQAILESAHRWLIINTQNGNPMILAEELSMMIGEELRLDPRRVEAILESEGRCPTLNKTTRVYGETINQRCYSLCLSMVSIESIVWILKSIKNDKMQPSESLVFSRFKEYFSLKVVMKDWKKLIEYLLKHKERLDAFNKHKDAIDEIEIREVEDGNYLLLLRGLSWTYEDLSEVFNNDQDYIAFRYYLDVIFGDEKDTQNEAELKRIITSTDPTKKRPTLPDATRKQTPLDPISKSIPGGKYGCAQYIKNCGPPILRQTSIGRIYALLRCALNNRLISHSKTNIIKNDDKAVSVNQNREEQIAELQENVLELLREEEKGTVTLAQLPLLLQKKYGKFYNFQELGFIKLKNFLNTLEDKIELTRSSNNHIKVSLKQRPGTHFGHHLSPVESVSSNFGSEMRSVKPRTGSGDGLLSFRGAKEGQWGRERLGRPETPHKVPPDSPDRLSPEKTFELSQDYGLGTFLNAGTKRLLEKKPVEPPSHDSMLYDRTANVNSFDSTLTAKEFIQQFDSIKNFIIGKMSLCRFGLEMKKLEAEVNEFLGYPFRAKSFHAENFHQFLKQNFSNELDITIKKTVKSIKMRKVEANPEYIIFPRSGVATKIGSNSESFDSANRSANSGVGGHIFENQLNSDNSYSGLRRAGVDGSRSETGSANRLLLYQRKDSWSNKADDDGLDRIFRDDDHYPLSVKNENVEEPNASDLANNDEIIVNKSIVEQQQRFINYINEDSKSQFS